MGKEMKMGASLAPEESIRRDFEQNICVPPWAAGASETLNRNTYKIFVYLRGPQPTLGKEKT